MTPDKALKVLPEGYRHVQLMVPMRDGVKLVTEIFIPSLGGNWAIGPESGAHDQRPLDERGDILRFATGPLVEPVGITGKVRLDLHVSSSSDPAYEVHPNTYHPAASMDEARPARNTVRTSSVTASRLILPVIPSETYAE
jgi:predicted acyl esterase